MKEYNSPVQAMYDQRKNFVVVSLTGITGSGCSQFADIMSREFSEWSDDANMRTLEEIDAQCNHGDKEERVFYKEFKTCYDFCNSNYEPFVIIKYKNVVVLYLMWYYAKANVSFDVFISSLKLILEMKFRHSTTGCDIHYKFDNTFSEDVIRSWGFEESIYQKIRDVLNDTGMDSISRKNNENNELAYYYFSPKFSESCEKMYEELKTRDYYSKNLFVHRIASAIRAVGNPEADYDSFKDTKDTAHVFDLVDLINKIIKGYHILWPDRPRRFVIDSIRNSMEILYLRERYNAFFSIAIHNDGRERETLLDKIRPYVQDDELVKRVCKNIMRLSFTENKHDDFESGKLYSPDLSRCVSESELHINFNKKKAFLGTDTDSINDTGSLTFYSFAEQWMKFYSLICRPGIITPSKDERSMSIALVAKFNSGCISRQVGCAIVDKENAVLSIGWNDPPSSQLPCNLRYVDELLERHDEKQEDYREYSRFELLDNTPYSIKDKEGNTLWTEHGFCGCIRHEVSPESIDNIKKAGLKYPYCFRTRYNRYKGQKDNVNTRSLHAEENTMLRISKRGGIGMDGGTMYVTASPCILCSKKAYQIGIRNIVYLDPYTDIAPDLILHCGFDQPRLRPFSGAIGNTFNKLYQPFLPFKDELKIYNDIFNEGGEQ